jgi:membrane protein
MSLWRGKLGVYSVLILLLLIFYLQIFVEIPSIRFVQQVFKVVVLALMSFSFVRNFELIRKNHLMILLILFSMLFVLSSLFSEYFKLVAATLLVLFSGVYFYIETYKNRITDKTVSFFFMLYFIISIYKLFISLKSDIGMYGTLEGLGGDNLGYTLLLMFPMCLLYSRKVSLGMALVILVSVLICRKRGAIISMVFPAIMYFIYYFRSFKRGFVSVFFSLILIFCISFFLFYFISSYSTVILSRFESLGEGGSGRDLLYGLIWENWSNSLNILNLLFGYGFYSTMTLTENALGYARYAHSDILEILYDFGLIGFLLYMGFLGLLCYWVKRLRKYDTKLYYMLLSTVLIFIPKALFSGIFFDVEALILMVIIGYCIGKYKQMKYCHES